MHCGVRAPWPSPWAITLQPSLGGLPVRGNAIAWLLSIAQSLIETTLSHIFFLLILEKPQWNQKLCKSGDSIPVLWNSCTNAWFALIINIKRKTRRGRWLGWRERRLELWGPAHASWLCHWRKRWVRTSRFPTPSLSFSIYKMRLVHSCSSDLIRITQRAC